MDKVKTIFLWLATLTGLIVLIIGAIGLLDLGLRKYVFTKADSVNCAYISPISIKGQPDPIVQCEQQQAAQQQRDAANDLAMIIVGAPVFYGFYRKAR